MEIVVVLNNVRSIHNVGSIFRTADGAGVKKIYLGGITSAPVDEFGKPRPQLTKVSLGAESYVEWEKLSATGKLLKELKKNGYKIFAIEQSQKSIPYYKLKIGNRRLSAKDRSAFGGKIALILGNERKGLPPAILKHCDKILEIPMKGAMVRQAHHPRRAGRGKESLNVAVAFGIVAYHLKFSA